MVLLVLDRVHPGLYLTEYLIFSHGSYVFELFRRKTRAIRSYLSLGLWPSEGGDLIFGLAGLHMDVTNKSGVP